DCGRGRVERQVEGTRDVLDVDRLPERGALRDGPVASSRDRAVEGSEVEVARSVDQAGPHHDDLEPVAARPRRRALAGELARLVGRDGRGARRLITGRPARRTEDAGRAHMNEA